MGGFILKISIAALIVAGVFVALSDVSAAQAACSPLVPGAISINGSLTQAQATITNPNAAGSGCAYPVGLASYKTYVLLGGGNNQEYIDTQTLFDSYLATLQPGEEVTLSVDLPNCNWQVDLFRGSYAPVPPDFANLTATHQLFSWKQKHTLGVCGAPQSPSVDIRANGSNGPITISYNSAATISWTSQNASSCSVSPNGWNGTSGSQSSGNLTFGQTYTVFCSGPGGSATDSVVVQVGSAPLPSADIKANGSDGPITISYDSSATISWTSQNVSTCSVTPSGWTGTSGSQSSGNLTAGQTYQLSCSGQFGTVTDYVVVSVGQAPLVGADIKANSSDVSITIPYNSAATISWTSQGASTCSITPGNWTGTSGSQSSGNLTNSQVYQISCSGPGGYANDYVTVNVQGQSGTVSADIKANGSDGTVSVSYNSSATISWTSQNASYCSVSPMGWTGTSGSQSSGNLTATQTYLLYCNGANGSASDSVTVSVSQSSLLPTVDLYASPRTINQGQTSYLNWTSQNANSCSVYGGWSGSRSTYGSEYVTPQFTTTYTITCVNNYGVAQDSDTVTVNTPTSNPSSLSVTKNGLNRTLNQAVFVNFIEAQGQDALEFELRVRNTDSTGGTVTVRDVLPFEMNYITGSTRVNGLAVADGITTGGISLGYLQPNEEKIVRLQATVIPTATSRLVTNLASASMNAGIQTSSMSIQIKPRGQVLGAADIVTGPENILPWALFLGFMSSLMIYGIFFWMPEHRSGGFAGKTTAERKFSRLVAQIKKNETIRS